MIEAGTLASEKQKNIQAKTLAALALGYVYTIAIGFRNNNL
jgi:hypothetical protein